MVLFSRISCPLLCTTKTPCSAHKRSPKLCSTSPVALAELPRAHTFRFSTQIQKREYPFVNVAADDNALPSLLTSCARPSPTLLSHLLGGQALPCGAAASHFMSSERLYALLNLSEQIGRI